MRKVNLGCGPVTPQDWFNVDVTPGHGVDVVRDVRDGLPFDDDSVTVVVANHVLQMLAYPELVPTLVELRRILEPGGALRVIVPDLVGAFRAWDEGAGAYFPIDDRLARTAGGKLCLYVSQAGATRSVFTEDWLFELLAAAGFDRILWAAYGRTSTTWPEITSLDSRAGESLFVEARA